MAKVNETGSGTNPPQIKLSRTFAAPRETAFNAWTSADHIKRWFCPADFTVPQAKVETRVGGPFEVCMRSPQGTDHWTRGRFTEVIPFERISIEMNVLGASDRTVFIAHTLVTFTDHAGGTRMDVFQTYTLLDPAGLPMIQGASDGWRQTLDRLESEITRMQDEHETRRSVTHAIFHLERAYEASPQRVWMALTDTEAKAKWFGGTPGQWELLDRQMDIRAGGHERLKGRWKGGVVSTFDAIYHDVVPNERLIYSYDMYLDDKKISVSLATIQLIAEGTETKLQVTEQGAFLDGYDDAGSREHGTGSLLDRLGESLKA